MSCLSKDCSDWISWINELLTRDLPKILPNLLNQWVIKGHFPPNESLIAHLLWTDTLNQCVMNWTNCFLNGCSDQISWINELLTKDLLWPINLYQWVFMCSHQQWFSELFSNWISELTRDCFVWINCISEWFVDYLQLNQRVNRDSLWLNKWIFNCSLLNKEIKIYTIVMTQKWIHKYLDWASL